MTTLLTGASGFVGGWIARTLGTSPPALRVLARPASDLSTLSDVPLQLAQGDLLDPESLRQAMAGVREVYHAAGVISFRPKDEELVWHVNYEGTINLFEAALSAGVEKVVYTASVFALGCATDAEHPAIEDLPFNASDLLDIPYLNAKRAAELAAQQAIDRGLPLVRLYPGLCLGPGDRNRSSSAAIEQWLLGRLPAIVRGGGICLVDVRDAAAAHVAAMRQGVPGRRYLATGHNTTLKGLFARLSRIAGRAAPRLCLPLWMTLPPMQVAEHLGLTLPLDSAQARLMARYWWFDSTRAREELGIRFRNLDETLADTVAWFRSLPTS